MTEDSQEAVEALIESDSYVNKKASDTIAQSLLMDFQMLLQLKLFSIILSKFEDPVTPVEEVKKDWEKRSTAFLKSEAKRFQDVMLKSSASENRKLSDELQTIFSDYSRTLSNAYSKADKTTNDIIDVLLNKTPTKKENEND